MFGAPLNEACLVAIRSCQPDHIRPVDLHMLMQSCRLVPAAAPVVGRRRTSRAVVQCSEAELCLVQLGFTVNCPAVLACGETDSASSRRKKRAWDGRSQRHSRAVDNPTCISRNESTQTAKRHSIQTHTEPVNSDLDLACRPRMLDS